MPTMKNPIPVFGVIGGVLGILISLCLGTRALLTSIKFLYHVV